MVIEEEVLKSKGSHSNSVKSIKEMERTAKANWQGNLKEGKGTISAQSGFLDKANYSFKTRFEGEKKGTNPEELLGAALAGCFTMAVSAILTKRGFNPTSLDTTATVKMEGLNIDTIHLSISGHVMRLTADEFSEVTNDAGKNCIISKALCTSIRSEAHLIS